MGNIYSLAIWGVVSYIIYKRLVKPSKFKHKLKHEPKTSEKYFGNYEEDEKVWTTKPSEEKPIKLSKSGLGSTPARTFFEIMNSALKAKGDSMFMKRELKDDSGEYTKWEEYTLTDFHKAGTRCARSLITLGVDQWSSVGLVGFNSPEYYIAQLGTLYAGSLVAGIYTTNNPGQCKYIAEHSKAQVIFVENEKQFNKFRDTKDQLKDLKAMVIWDKSVGKEVLAKANDSSIKVYSFDEFLGLGDGNKDADRILKDRQSTIKPGHCCLLIYTSGTTGPPKAVMISHDAIIYIALCVWHQVKSIKRSGKHALVSYLPLSHIAAQLADFFFPIVGLASYNIDEFPVYFARPDALKGSLSLTIKAAKPTIFFGVPRVWEKFYEAIQKIKKKKPPNFIMSAVIDWLRNVGLQAFNNKQVDGNLEIPFGYSLWEMLLKKRLIQALGFDRMQVCACGAAPPQRATLNYFGSMGIPIVEIYGMSESTGIVTCTLPYNYLIGSVGHVLEGMEIVLDHVDGRDKPNHGEICMRGRGVMSGYMYDVDKTKETIDSKGYLHSGDVGEFVNVQTNGAAYELLKITGRIKELIITSGGENVAPVPIENYIKSNCPGLSHVVVIGDKRKYLTCIITLKVQQNMDTLQFSNNLTGDALKIDEKCKTVDDAMRSQKWKNYIDTGIKKYNDDKEACPSNAQKVQYWRILHGDFSIAEGEITDTMKLKRPVILKKYDQVIESMYTFKK